MKNIKNQEKSGPVVIARHEHEISRKLISPNALRVLYRLKDNGFAGYLVGGCVRDLLLGREPKDFDVVTNATPGEVKRIFRNCRLVGRRFRLAHIHFQNEIIELATFRSQAPDEPETETEPKEADGAEQRRHPRMLKDDDGMILRDNVYGTPEEDALRRDFTVNSLSYNIADFSIIDYTGGLADLNAGIIRTIGDPDVRFQEDPVRMLRAVRFAAQLGFTIEEKTRKALVAAADTIVRAAPPRLFDEMLKLLSGEGAKCYDLLRQTGLFQALFPDFTNWLSEESEGFPHTRFGEMLECVDSRVQQGTRVSPPLLLALLFGEYIDGKTGRFRQQGMPWQQSVNAAVAEFMGETCPIIMITNRVAIALREIISQQMRLKKIPGRRPESFTARDDFNDIIEYCRITRGDKKDVARLLDWWTAQSRQQEPVPVPAELAAAGEAPQRKKRRRRRRKPNTKNRTEAE